MRTVVVLLLLVLVFPVVPAVRHGPDDLFYEAKKLEQSQIEGNIVCTELSSTHRVEHRFKSLRKKAAPVPPSGPSKGHNSVWNRDGLDSKPRTP